MATTLSVNYHIEGQVGDGKDVRLEYYNNFPYIQRLIFISYNLFISLDKFKK